MKVLRRFIFFIASGFESESSCKNIKRTVTTTNFTGQQGNNNRIYAPSDQNRSLS